MFVILEGLGVEVLLVRILSDLLVKVVLSMVPVAILLIIIVIIVIRMVVVGVVEMRRLEGLLLFLGTLVIAVGEALHQVGLLEALRLLEFLEFLVGVLVVLVWVVLLILVLIFRVMVLVCVLGLIFLEIRLVLMLLVHLLGRTGVVFALVVVHVFLVAVLFARFRLHGRVDLFDREDDSGVETVVQEIVFQGFFLALLVGIGHLLDLLLHTEGESAFLFGDAEWRGAVHLETVFQQHFALVATVGVLAFEVETHTGHIFLVTVDELQRTGLIEVPDSDGTVLRAAQEEVKIGVETDAVDGLEMTFEDKQEFFSHHVIVGNVLVVGGHGHFVTLVVELDHFDLAVMGLLEVVVGLVVLHVNHLDLAGDAAMRQVDLVRREAHCRDRLQLEQFLLQFQRLGVVYLDESVQTAGDEEVD